MISFEVFILDLSGGREATLFESDLKTTESTLLLKETGSILDVSIRFYFLLNSSLVVVRASAPGIILMHSGTSS